MVEAASQPIVVRGSYFWRGKDRFLIRGVVYQSRESDDSVAGGARGPIDPITDDRLPHLQHDITLFQELGVNSIFVYMIDHTKCHDKAMKMLQEAGIYVLASISTPSHAINRMTPHDSYNSTNMDFWFRTVDILANYPNTLGLVAANGVINEGKSIACAPIIAAVVRDVKTYMRLRNEVSGQRMLPVGYAAAAALMHLESTLDYLAAGDESDSIDFWSSANYSWFGPSNIQISGYNSLLRQSKDKNLPMFFSEYGAQNGETRPFDETRAILSHEMTHVFSGGFVYEFWFSTNRYGLVRMLTGREQLLWNKQELPEDAMPATTYDLNFRRRFRPRVSEIRETEFGTLLILKDFKNYRESLEAVSDEPPNTDQTRLGRREFVERRRNMFQSRYFPDREQANLDPVPDSCVDWTEVATPSAQINREVEESSERKRKRSGSQTSIA